MKLCNKAIKCIIIQLASDHQVKRTFSGKQ